ncbi:MAG: helix-turn-helix transcriptional regulator [Candidatus Margulisiibacteriota bacterium]
MPHKKLGQRIKKLRQQKELTIEKLAYENDLAKGNLSEIEKGLIDPKLSTLQRIAAGLGISTKELLDF